MQNIDLTSPESALNYLRSLDPNTELSLPGHLESNTEGDAVRAVTGCANANEWANNHRRWDWTAGELVVALLVGRTVAVTEEGEGEIVRVLPDGDVEVSFEDGNKGFYSLAEIEL